MLTKKSILSTFLRLALLLAIAIPAFGPGAQPAKAQNGVITLRVVEARTDPSVTIPEYDFLISVDNTGDPFFDTEFLSDGVTPNPNYDATACNPYMANGTRNPDYPDGCDLTSIRTVPGWAPVYIQGDHTLLNEIDFLEMPNGKYLITVTADGFKLDGEHFTVNDDVGLIEVQMHPFPLPPATMVIQVFNDVEMTNGQFDVPSEVYDTALDPTDPYGTNYPMSGFRASINDIAGEITTDIFGNPLCTTYAANGDVETPGTPEACMYSDADGIITIKNIGPMRYDVLIFPPNPEPPAPGEPPEPPWIQTTTLEGSQGWDTWLQEAGTGLDNEFLIAAEPAPWTLFGFVKASPPDLNLGGSGSITGVIMAASTFVPAKGGLPYIGDTFGGFAGTKLHRPIANPWLSLNDLQAGDKAVWVGQGNADGSFNIPNVPGGNYILTYWDEKQHYILDLVQVTVPNFETSDVGIRMLTGWFTEIYGTVFLDDNENGRRDDGETGIPDYLVVFKDRDNTEIDRMSISALTNPDGFYELEKGYPMGSWMVLEAYSDLFRTTGVTYQTLNMNEEVTLGPGIVDLGILPVLGQPIRVDWGVKGYTTSENGGIAGTVFYDTMRAEDDARYAGAEPFQPGIPGLTLNLYQAQIDPYNQPVLAGDGSYAKGQLLASTVTETFERPKGCQALDVDGEPVDFPPLPPAGAGKDCLEGPMMGTQAGDGQNNLDGNWGFGDGCYGTDGFDPVSGACADNNDPTPLTPGKYLVEVVIPNDASDNKMYQVTREEDLNMYDADVFVPAVPPPACAGPLHTVDVTDDGVDEYPAVTWVEGGVTITVPQSTPIENPGYAEVGGRYEGQIMPLCDVKFVELTNGKAVAPIFNLFTKVPIPGKWKGYLIDNLNVSVDPDTLFFGEMAGIPNAPIGLYDYSGRLVHTMHSDFNGVYEVLLPSTGTFGAPSPSGMFANVYYLYGNDPGPVGAPNPYYNPQYRSIGTSFEIYPGNIMPSDLAPTQNGAAVWSPTSQYDRLALCKLEDTQPQLFAVDKPYGDAGESITIHGLGFGAAGTLSLGDQEVLTTDWSDERITFSVPNIPGAHQLLVESANGLKTVNSLTFHILGGSYQPTPFEVGLGKTYDPTDPIYDPPATPPVGTPPDPFGWPRGPIQHAIDDAYEAGGDSLVVVYPGEQVEKINPLGMYIENPVLYAPVKLQGIGPGGTNSAGYHYGSIIDGRGVGGDSPYNLWWRETFLPDVWNNRGGWARAFIQPDGNILVHEGAVITLLAEDGEFGSAFNAAIDGFIIQGGDQQGFPNNPMGVNLELGQPVVVQGGGIFANGYAQNLQISNNLVQTNGGSYGGAIRLGTAHVPDDPLTAEDESSNYNENAVIAHNRILANGGTNLAGAIALFNGADNYEIAYNDLCGNSSIEYGGGISHYGYSPGGEIHHNRIYFNSSYDEGGGIMIAGELPSTPVLSTGAGAVDIHHNLVQSNLANDDGGGLRFLMAGLETYNVYNNMFVNNVSTHEGGGVSLNDAPSVNLVNNTIMKNITTATALTSNGLPAPAGLASSANSNLLQAEGAGVFSNPVQYNNIFWDNRAGWWDGNKVSGLGLEGDPLPIYYWDMGVADGSGVLNPQDSLLHMPYGDDPTNTVGEDPLVVSAYDTEIRILPWRGNFNFVGINIVAVDVPISLQADYHLMGCSPAVEAGREDGGAPLDDYDDDLRPQYNEVDIGADEVIDPHKLYFSTEGNNPIPGLSIPVHAANIYAWDGTNFCLVFDASAAGLPDNARLNALAVEDQDTFYLGLQPALTLPGITGRATPVDIVHYDAGAWSLLFDGSDVGLDASIDAFEILLSESSVLISGNGNVNVLPGQPQRDEDLLRCTGTFGPVTSCDWSFYFDGSDVGLTDNVNGAHVAGSDIYLSTQGPFSIGPLTGGGEDVFTCNSANTGPNTDCASYSLYFDGTVNGILDDITALDVPNGITPAGLVEAQFDGFVIFLPLVED